MDDRFCQKCGAFLKRNHFGDRVCPNCGDIAFESEKVDLNKVEVYLIDKRKISDILYKIEKYDPTEYVIDVDSGELLSSEKDRKRGLQGHLYSLQERVSIEVTKYIEAYEGRKSYDVSDKPYHGFDLYTIDPKTSRRRYIEVKSSFDKKRDLGLTKNEVGFLTDSSKEDRWIYALFFDKEQLLHGKFDECFDFFKIPCNEIVLSDFDGESYYSDAVLPSHIWRKIAHRTKLVLNPDLNSLFELFRTQYKQIT